MRQPKPAGGRDWARLIVILSLLLCICPAQSLSQTPPSTQALAFILKAGNNEDEIVRQAALEELASSPEASDELRREATALAIFARQWNKSALKFYSNQVRKKPVKALGDYDFGIAADSPLRPLAQLYRGRMLAWTLIEKINISTDP